MNAIHTYYYLVLGVSLFEIYSNGCEDKVTNRSSNERACTVGEFGVSVIRSDHFVTRTSFTLMLNNSRLSVHSILNSLMSYSKYHNH